MPDCTSSATSRMPCLRRQLAQPLQELVGRDDVAALALNRLDDDRGDFVGRDQVHEELVLDVVEALRRARLRRRAERAAIAVRVRRVIDARHHRAEAAPLDRLARRQRQRAHACGRETPPRNAMMFVPPGRVARQLEARLDRLGAGVAEERSHAALDRRRSPRAPRPAAPAARSRSRCPTCAGTSAPAR